MKRLIVGKDVNYAASASGTAATPDELVSGAVGIFAIDPATGKSVLVTTGNDSTLVTAGLDEYVVAVGTTEGGPVVSQPISISSTNAGFPKAAAASADVAHTVAVGYNGTSGSLNLPTLADKDFAEVKLSRTTNGLNQRIDKDSFEGSNLRASDDAYDVVKAVLASWNARDNDVKFTTFADIISNGTGAAFATSATATVTNGSPNVTTSAAHGVGVGDYVSLANVASGQQYTYQAVTGTTGTTLVLDRPWQGDSQTVLNADTLDLGATIPTEFGMVFSSSVPGLTFEASVLGVFEDADTTVTAAGIIGLGSKAYMDELVRVNAASLGFYDQIDRRRPAPDFNLTVGASYDIYYIYTSPEYKAKDEMDGKFSTAYEVQVAFVDGGSNSNQSTFQAIVEVLNGLSASDLDPA